MSDDQRCAAHLRMLAADLYSEGAAAHRHGLHGLETMSGAASGSMTVVVVLAPGKRGRCERDVHAGSLCAYRVPRYPCAARMALRADRRRSRNTPQPEQVSLVEPRLLRPASPGRA